MGELDFLPATTQQSGSAVALPESFIPMTADEAQRFKDYAKTLLGTELLRLYEPEPDENGYVSPFEESLRGLTCLQAGLRKMVRNTFNRDEVSLGKMQFLWNHAFGKATQRVEATVTSMSMQDILKMADQAEKRYQAVVNAEVIADAEPAQNDKISWDALI